ncbi:hypothetical protein O9G_006210 [Rozella allomycis CSF55]|uniref:Reverse transcriptase domain-containing protein n=1 Tax=Rozella allomycis (strain CSF55) TaxID=988480 RepID=A0A075B1E4_ROZAC|nr:hypothetical protein O9G_006210 [Rozella allomycis CSF55]|eukprot:EPZ34791.1 hypothetical protein O9G_006210 [Rozella allomycis CSF55]
MTKHWSKYFFVHVYIDDIIIHSESYAEHVKHVETVVKELNRIHLVINMENSCFAYEQLDLLGFKINRQGIQAVPDKLLIEGWEIPFRDLVPNYAAITSPLDKLRKAKTITWTKEYEDIYQTLRKIFWTQINVKYHDFNHPFCIATDASNKGLGAVLYHEDDNQIHYNCFASRASTQGERNYSATK